MSRLNLSNLFWSWFSRSKWYHPGGFSSDLEAAFRAGFDKGRKYERELLLKDAPSNLDKMLEAEKPSYQD